MRDVAEQAIGELVAAQRALDDSGTADGAAAPAQVLSAGTALLAFAEHEAALFSSLSELLDSAVQAELADEHRQIAEDLALLEWLQRMAPGSPDVGALAASLASRMRRHVARDARFLQLSAAPRPRRPARGASARRAARTRPSRS